MKKKQERRYEKTRRMRRKYAGVQQTVGRQWAREKRLHVF
jgi:hypothetical protein